MNRGLCHISAALVGLLLLPASGLAALPKPRDPLVVVPASIGGVELGQRLEDADRAWGRNGDCDLSPGLKSCAYASRNPRKGRAWIDAAVHKRVSSFAIVAGRDDEGNYVFEGKLRKFETPEGIGLGDMGRKIPKAYPDAIKTAGKTGYLIEGRGKSYMTVQTLGGKRITAITIVDGVHQG